MIDKNIFGDSDFLKVAEVAQILNVTDATVRRLIRNQELQAIMIGKRYRIPRVSLMKKINPNMDYGGREYEM
jgi:excisionase family DNA binding protein